MNAAQRRKQKEKVLAMRLPSGCRMIFQAELYKWLDMLIISNFLATHQQTATMMVLLHRQCSRRPYCVLQLYW